MKKLIAALGVALSMGINAAQAAVHVHGYIRQNGTYVQPYYRSNPDGNVNNNWSTYPNVNPYTGAIGTHHAETLPATPRWNAGNAVIEPSYRVPSYQIPTYQAPTYQIPSYQLPRINLYGVPAGLAIDCSDCDSDN